MDRGRVRVPQEEKPEAQQVFQPHTRLLTTKSRKMDRGQNGGQKQLGIGVTGLVVPTGTKK